MTKLGTTVLHNVPPAGALDALEDRVKELHGNDYNALIVSPLHPATRLLPHFAQQDGLDMSMIGLIDCTGDTDSSGADTPGDNILFVESPALLENVLLRVDRLLGRMGPKTAVIVHTLDAFAMYTSDHMVVEFVNCLVNKLRPRGTDIELLCICTKDTDKIVGKLENMVDMTLDVPRK